MGIRALFLFALSSVAMAEVRLPHVFSDHAVLQRNQPVRIWGWAGSGEHISVNLHDQYLTVQADAYGAWEVWLKPEAAGGPYTLKVTGDTTAQPLERSDILVGDVWLASGQSNMEFPLKGIPTAKLSDSDKEIASANHPRIRLLHVKRTASDYPLSDADSTWLTCTPETAADFSAVAYFFGRKISQEENVPVGLIETAWGGTPAHSWISQEGIAWASLSSIAVDAGKIAALEGRANAANENMRIQDEVLKAAGKTPPIHPRIPGDHGAAWTPSALFNAMVAPYVNFTLKGFLWYQGETDAGGIKALNYSRVFPALIQDWRKRWGEGPLPFLFVQISSFDGGEGWGAVRDAQRRALELVNTGMAVTIDVGLAENIHPPDKQTVGLRLAKIALGTVYGKKIKTASPLFLQATTEGDHIRAWFSHADGLTTKGAAPGDFEVAGDDGKFVPATAKIEEVGDVETVIATAPSVSAPKYIRYGWTPVVKSYLYNSDGLPMSTFTSISDIEMLAAIDQ
jgi:sialate O-acetylesterase